MLTLKEKLWQANASFRNQQTSAFDVERGLRAVDREDKEAWNAKQFGLLVDVPNVNVDDEDLPKMRSTNLRKYQHRTTVSLPTQLSDIESELQRPQVERHRYRGFAKKDVELPVNTLDDVAKEDISYLRYPTIEQHSHQLENIDMFEHNALQRSQIPYVDKTAGDTWTRGRFTRF